ncbi:MAG TPA: phosphate ABC transporter substrate-binding protein PstS [Vicinamibacterales bacterium]|nr:phosphate ABC transporter substrate-binding protein PstS [Vicinamibacterales bacterium]
MKQFLYAAAAAVTLAGATLAAQTITINGAGATFPAPIYQKWFAEYNRQHGNVRINYQPLGSGAGIRQITERTVFFGATDGPMTNEQLQAAAGRILHLPTVLGAVVPIYNLPGVSQELKFSGPVLANIFLGKITKWNDPALTALNQGVKLPDTDIVVAHRSDGSGTTYIWLDFLAKVSPDFKKTVGVGTSAKWPVGVAAAKNDGVAAIVKQTPGALGYVELIYALQTRTPYGSVQNMNGKFVKASIDAVTAAAAAAAKQMPADYRVSITNAPGDAVYPISSFTWLLLYQDPRDKAQSKAMVEFMKWALTAGQKFAGEMGYAPLPRNVVDMEMKTLATIKVQ